jgi:hypothetical protein
LAWLVFKGLMLALQRLLLYTEETLINVRKVLASIVPM